MTLNFAPPQGLLPGYGTKRAAPQKPRQKVTNQPPVSPNGIEVAIGPHDKQDTLPTNTVLTVWTTFHITPEAIGPAGTAQWGQNQIVGGPALPIKSGYQPRQFTWSGELEPPLIYLTSLNGTVTYMNGERVTRSAEDTFPTDIQPVAQLDALALTNYNKTTGASSFVDTTPTDLGTDAMVVMQTGATAGGHYIEPHAFATTIDLCRSKGEVLRLIIGDQYGTNCLVHVTSWEWQFSDSDPDVLYYNVTFEEHFIAGQDIVVSAANNNSSSSAKTNQGKTGSSSNNTPSRIDLVDGMTLYNLAAQYLGSGQKWTQLLALNKPYIEKMYKNTTTDETERIIYAPMTYSIGVNQVTPNDPRVGTTSANIFSPQTPFRAGGTLRLKS